MRWTFLALMLLATASIAQQAVGQQPAANEGQPGTTTQPSQESQQDMGQMQGMGMMQNMDKMAMALTRMAEFCEQMMQKEIAAMPYKLTAGISLAVLAFVALVLLVVLQVQWIIYWSRL